MTRAAAAVAATHAKRGVLLLGFASVAFLGCRDREQEKKSDSTEAEQAQASALTFEWADKKQAVYSFQIVSSSRLGGAPAPFSLELEGNVTVDVRRQGSTVSAIFRIQDPKLLQSNGSVIDGVDGELTALSEPFGGIYEKGTLAAYLDPDSASAFSFGMRRTLAAAFQFPPEISAGGEVTHFEWDSTGMASVEYRRKSDNSASFAKRSYEKVIARPNAPLPEGKEVELTPQITESTGIIAWGSRAPTKMSRHEEISLLMGREMALSAATEVELTRQSLHLSKVTADEWTKLVESFDRNAVEAAPDFHSVTDLDTARVGGRSFEEIVKQIASLPEAGPSGVGSTERGALFQALAGIFRLKPETVELARVLVEKEPSSRISSVVMDALASASTDATIEALLEMIRDGGKSKPFRLHAARSLIRVPRPNEAAILWAESAVHDADFREHALLGAGTFSRKFRFQGQPELDSRATRFLERQLAAAQRPSDLEPVLYAIANGGSDELLDEVVAYQKSDDPTIQAAAIQAIRLMKDGRVEPRLRELLQSKSNVPIKAAIEALAVRNGVGEKTIERVCQLASTHSLDSVRQAAVEALSNWADESKFAGRCLGKVIESEKSSAVRRTAAQGLSTAQ